MLLFTYIARLTDGVMLVASIDSSASSNSSLEVHKSDGKQILRQLNQQANMHSQSLQCTIDSGEYCFHYIIEGLIVYLTFTPKTFSKRVAFMYLSELHSHFKRFVTQSLGSMSMQTQWEDYIATIDRPYAFIKFDSEIQRLRRDFLDPLASRSTRA